MRGLLQVFVCRVYIQLVGFSFTEKLLVTPDAGLYSMINQGVLTVDGIDDVEEMKLTDEAFDVLGFSAEEKLSLYKCTILITDI